MGTKNPPIQHTISRSLTVAYFMLDTSVKVFRLALWREDMADCESGEFSFVYQRWSPIFWEAKNLTGIIRTVADKVNMYDT